MVGRVVRAASAGPVISPVTATVVAHVVSGGIIDPIVVAYVMGSGIIDPIVIAHVMGSGVINPIVIPDIVGGGIIHAARETRQRVIGDAGRALATLVIGGRNAGTLSSGDLTGRRFERRAACGRGKSQRRKDSDCDNATGHDKPPKYVRTLPARGD
jgi:hypothetical protein